MLHAINMRVHSDTEYLIFLFLRIVVQWMKRQKVRQIKWQSKVGNREVARHEKRKRIPKKWKTVRQ